MQQIFGELSINPVFFVSVSNEDMSYFPSVQLSLVMTMVMFISTFTTTVHVNKMTLQLDTNKSYHD